MSKPIDPQVSSSQEVMSVNLNEKKQQAFATSLLNACKAMDITAPKEFKKTLKELGNQELKAIDHGHLQLVIDQFFEYLASEEFKGSITADQAFALIDEFVKVMPHDKKNASIQSRAMQDLNPSEYFSQVISQLNVAMHAVELNAPAKSYNSIRRLFDQLIDMIESIVMIFGIQDFFTISELQEGANNKLNKLITLVGIVGACAAVLLPTLGTGIGAIVLVALVFAMTIFSVVFPHIRTMPKTLPTAENLTTLCQKGILSSPSGYDHHIDHVAQMLHEQTFHPLLVGPTGVGKSQIIKGLVHAIEKGQYPHLAGKEVFYINTARLVAERGDGQLCGNALFTRIKERISRYKEDAILVFDNIHLACQSRQEVLLADELKRWLGNEEEGFPYVIGITTEEDYQKDVASNNQTFAARFKKVEIQEPNQEQLLAILEDYALKHAQDIPFESNVFAYIIEYAKVISPSTHEPQASLSLLKKAIYQVRQLPEPKELQESSSRLQAMLHSQREEINHYTLQHEAQLLADKYKAYEQQIGIVKHLQEKLTEFIKDRNEFIINLGKLWSAQVYNKPLYEGEKVHKDKAYLSKALSTLCKIKVLEKIIFTRHQDLKKIADEHQMPLVLNKTVIDRIVGYSSNNPQLEDNADELASSEKTAFEDVLPEEQMSPSWLSSMAEAFALISG